MVCFGSGLLMCMNVWIYALDQQIYPNHYLFRFPCQFRIRIFLRQLTNVVIQLNLRICVGHMLVHLVAHLIANAHQIFIVYPKFTVSFYFWLMVCDLIDSLKIHKYNYSCVKYCFPKVFYEGGHLIHETPPKWLIVYFHTNWN